MDYYVGDDPALDRVRGLTERLTGAADREALCAVLAERDKLAAFKRYVHERLDVAGVPLDPDPQRTSEHGCRIGGRLDWLLANRVTTGGPG